LNDNKVQKADQTGGFENEEKWEKPGGNVWKLTGSRSRDEKGILPSKTRGIKNKRKKRKNWNGSIKNQPRKWDGGGGGVGVNRGWGGGGGGGGG